MIDNLKQTQTAVADILGALGIVRVVYVDDENGGTVSLEATIASAQGLDGEELFAAFPELGMPMPDDPDVLIAKIRSTWERLETTVQEDRGRAVVTAARLKDGNETDDPGDISILTQLIPEPKLISLSPSQWETQQGQLLEDSKEQRTLFLFDRDFGGGNTEAGIRIIASLIEHDTSHGLMCGLLTHTITPENLPQGWIDLSIEHSIPKDRFVVIPKRHLHKDPIVFAQTLKFAALSSDFAELKTKTRDIIASSASAAASLVDEVSIYDLDQIVFKVSAEEGLWEPDMLFRLHAMFHRLESLKLAHDGGALELIAAKLRRVSGIPANMDAILPASSTWTLQRTELYESSSHLNDNHLPIELGDIFERTGTTGKKRYVLLAQPCDLMVRRDGKRHPELLRLPLAEVVQSDKVPANSEEMPCYDESPERKWYVKLKIVHFVRSCILDLCAFNSNGDAKIALDGTSPTSLRPPWKARHAYMLRLAKSVAQRADSFTVRVEDTGPVKAAKQKIAKEVGSILLEDEPFKGVIDLSDGVGSLKYDCRRIGRLSRSRAIGLLMSYTSTVGRPAYDRTFG